MTSVASENQKTALFEVYLLIPRTSLRRNSSCFMRMNDFVWNVKINKFQPYL